MSAAEPRPIFVLEDSPEDFGILERLLTEDRIERPILRFGDATHALQALTESPESGRPCLIILDLNLPGMDGHTFLEKLQSFAELRTIPVVVLTSSDNPGDVRLAYQSGANGYVRKPNTYNEYKTAIDHLCNFWLHTAELPHRGRA